MLFLLVNFSLISFLFPTSYFVSVLHFYNQKEKQMQRTLITVFQ